jgi:hypothetical protein
MAHVARDAVDIVIVIAEAEVNGHVKSICDGLGVVESRFVLEVKVVISRWVIVEVVANKKYMLDGRIQRVDEIARGGIPRCSHEDAFVILYSVLASLYIEVIDDVGVGYERKIEVAVAGGGSGLACPQRTRQGSRYCSG